MLRNRNNDLSNSLEQVIEKSEEREKALIKTIEALKEQDKLLREKVQYLLNQVLYRIYSDSFTDERTRNGARKSERISFRKGRNF